MSSAHVKQFCRDTSWPPGELNFPRAILTEKAFPENELLLISAVTLEGPVEVSGKLIYEQRIGARSQFEVIAPFGLYRRSASERRATGLGRWGRGLGDVAFGFKHVVLHRPSSGTIASLGAELAIPTGSPAEGMGKDTYVFEPFITVGQGPIRLGLRATAVRDRSAFRRIQSSQGILWSNRSGASIHLWAVW